MNKYEWNEKVFKECLDRYNQGGKGYWIELATKYGYENGEQLRNKFKSERKRRGISSKEVVGIETNTPTEKYEEVENFNDDNYKEKIEQSADGTLSIDRLIEISEEDSKNPDSVMKAHNLESSKWDVISYKLNMWHSQRKNDAGRLIMYQSKIVVRPKKKIGVTFEDIDMFFKEFQSDKNSSVEKALPVKTLNNDVLEIALADVHIGNKSYDGIEKVENNFNSTFDRIFLKSKDRKFSKICLVMLGDFFDFDTFKQTTTSGTQMEGSLNYTEMFDLGCKLMIRSIDNLKKIAPIEILYVGGNHDRTFGYFLVKSLEFYYRLDKSVSVDSGHFIRKFRKFGKSLVGFCHGDMPKANISTWLQKEARKEYGDSEQIEVHAGHYHTQTTIEKEGVIVRYLPTMCDSSTWSYDKGYSSIKSTVCFVWDKEKGLSEQWFINV